MSAGTHSVGQNPVPDQFGDTPGVQLVPRYDDDISHPNCLVVAPFRKLRYGSTIMATIEHYRSNPERSGFPWTILSVIERPLELKAAVEEAMKYAAANGIPVVFLNQDGFSSDQELQKTDTKALKTGAPRAR